MASKDTGFHTCDPDWTRGRATAVAEADALARRQISMSREIALRELARLGQAFDAAVEQNGTGARISEQASEQLPGVNRQHD